MKTNSSIKISTHYDGELESVANSMEVDLKKRNMWRKFFYVVLFFTLIYLLYLFIKYPGEQNPPPLNIIILGLGFVISGIGFSIFNDEKIDKIIFKNMREKIFFYLFISWKYHNDKKSKKYLKSCIDEIDIYLDNYRNLAYTEDVYSTFDKLYDVLKYHIYPKLGERGDVESQGDLGSQVSAWDEFKSLSLDFYQNSPIDLINEKVSNVKNHFERNETVELADDNLFIKIVKTTFNWNINNYKDSVTYRFIFYLIGTGIMDYYLISNNLLTNDIIIPATILIPIMAPYYLAPHKYIK